MVSGMWFDMFDTGISVNNKIHFKLQDVQLAT